MTAVKLRDRTGRCLGQEESAWEYCEVWHMLKALRTNPRIPTWDNEQMFGFENGANAGETEIKVGWIQACLFGGILK